MKTVRIEHGRVAEIIPEYALPVAKWYGDEFAQMCVEAPDSVEQGWACKNGGFATFVDVEGQRTALESQLTDTDYKIIKCSEYSLAGLESPYDIAVLHAQRQAIRDQINTLEETV